MPEQIKRRGGYLRKYGNKLNISGWTTNKPEQMLKEKFSFKGLSIYAVVSQNRIFALNLRADAKFDLNIL